jgi:gas vesicle protein
MKETERKGRGTLTMLAIAAAAGVAVGAAVALLFLPEKKQLDKSLKKMQQKMSETIDAGKEAIEKFVEDSEGKLNDMKEKAQSKTEEALNDLKK